MMNIKHRPIFDTEKVIKHYEDKDGVPIRYICTSALNDGTLAADIFYRETPHPSFGNRYFGLYRNPHSEYSDIMITNADCIEDLDFTMIEVNGEYHYSQHRHDYYSVGNFAIDGGRAYARFTYTDKPNTKVFKVKDGEFVEYLD